MKKLLATILALVMALGVTTLSWADEKGAEGGEAGLNEVYVSHSKGDDSKGGTTVDNAVKTLRKAMELVKENGSPGWDGTCFHSPQSRWRYQSFSHW